MVTFRCKFIVYTGRLEVKFAKELDDANEHITAGAFNLDSTLLWIGTSMGRIYCYRVSDGMLDGNPF